MVGSSFLQSRNLFALVHPVLRRLVEMSGETVNLAVLDLSDHQAVIIDQVQCTQLMRMSAPIVFRPTVIEQFPQDLIYLKYRR